jgi:hypothetical protein
MLQTKHVYYRAGQQDVLWTGQPGDPSKKQPPPAAGWRHAGWMMRGPLTIRTIRKSCKSNFC